MSLKYPRQMRLRAARVLAKIVALELSIKSVPRSQREIEGKTTRRAQETLQPLFDSAKRAISLGTWHLTRADYMANTLTSYRMRLMEGSLESAEAAARYGKNRIVSQTQSLPDRGKGLTFTPLTAQERRAAHDMAALETGRMLRWLGEQVRGAGLDAPSPERLQRMLDRACARYGRELANTARCRAEYDTALALGDARRFEWEDSDDNRVRPSHHLLDGEQVVPGEPFSNGMRYPRDPEGPLNETMGCRCRLKVVL